MILEKVRTKSRAGVTQVRGVQCDAIADRLQENDFSLRTQPSGNFMIRYFKIYQEDLAFRASD